MGTVMVMDYLYFCGEYIYKKILPPEMRIWLMRFIDHNRYKLRRDILRFLEAELRENPDAEKEAVLKILRKNPVYMIPYAYDYIPPLHKITVYDDGSEYKYVLHDGKKLFFPAGWTTLQIQMTYTSLMREQHIKSPHRYETEDFCVQEGDVIADCGAAEGIWALSSAEKAGKIYLFECEKIWIDALEKTFAPWSGKVEIVNKFVSDADSADSVTLDKFWGGGGINFIKADIEGAEVSMLRGAQKTLTSAKNLRLSICTYHRQNDACDLEAMFKARGFSTSYSDGYMLFIYGDEPLKEPYLRRGIIRARQRV
jgi:hypothetical protein